MLNLGDELKWAVVTVAATGAGATATEFVITLGSSNGFTAVSGLTTANRTLTFDKDMVVDASGNHASSDVSFVVPDDITNPSGSAITRTTTDASATSTYGTNDTLQIDFSEEVAVANITIGNIEVGTGTLGNSSISAVNDVNGYASAFDITLAVDASLTPGSSTLSFAASNVVDEAGNEASAAVVFTAPTVATLELTNQSDIIRRI